MVLFRRQAKGGHVPKDLLGLQVLILGLLFVAVVWEAKYLNLGSGWEAAASSSRAGEGGRNYEFYGRLKYGKPHALGQSCASVASSANHG